MSSKRVKFLDTARTRPPQDQPHSAPDLYPRRVLSSLWGGGTEREHYDAHGDLKSRPPWCKSSGQFEVSPRVPQNAAESSCSQASVAASPDRAGTGSTAQATPSIRGPLSDITNALTEQARRRITSAVQQSADRSRERGGSKLGPTSVAGEKLREAAPKGARVQGLNARLAVLPTLPASSPCNAEGDTGNAKEKDVDTVPSLSSKPHKRLGAPAQREHLDKLPFDTTTAPRPAVLRNPLSTLCEAYIPKDCPVSASPILLSESL